MGFDKQLISLGNDYLIDLLIEKLKNKFNQIIIVSNTPKLFGDKYLEVYPDLIKNSGPLGGIYTGLFYSKSKYNYIIACDMPKINLKYINYMESLINNENEYSGVITRYKNWIEPFNGIYSKELLNSIKNYLFTGKKSINDFLRQSNTLFIKEEIARRYSPNWDMFYNLNDLKSLKEFRKRGNKYGSYKKINY